MKLVSRTLLCAAILPVIFACGGTTSSTSETKERIDQANDPDRLNVPLTFHKNPDFFPLQAQTEKAVWGGNWYPLSAGGTSKAMKKYDQAVGNGSKAEAWELNTAAASAGVSWAGHCNGLAAAGINEERPKHDVVYNGVTFTVADVEALLVEKWQGTSKVQLVGKRCYENPVPDAEGRVTQNACRDINPGALHIILGNMLGIKKKPIILDISQGEQVWNYPIISYTSDMEVIDLNQARALTDATGSGYSWDPTANQFMKVKTLLKTPTQTLTLEYVLEGSNDQITGGEWIGSSKQNHPDFAWYARSPDAVNPWLKVAIIDEIAKKSRE